MPTFPRCFRLRQRLKGPALEDVEGDVGRQLKRLHLERTIQPGQTVAVTAGSRGIANNALLLRATVDYLKQIGAEPFLVTAMGSHGGATKEGQLHVLETLGVTPTTVGCPIRATMETVIVGDAPQGFPIHFDRQAYEADHVLVLNRVKPHTMFGGQYQSGLLKMLLIGLGNKNGAGLYHRAAVDHDFDELVRDVWPVIRAKCGVAGGLAVVENGRGETALLAGIPVDEIESREQELLTTATGWMAGLPFDDVHLLLVDEIGKTISGTGMDTNVIGRKWNDHAAVAGEIPRVLRIAVRGVTHGNANGIGMAEFCTRRAVEAADWEATRINSLTSIHAPGGMVPHVFETDREMLVAALATIGLTEPPDAKLLWIKNTKELEEIVCSVAYHEEAQARDDLEIIGGPKELPFDDDGNLTGGTDIFPRQPLP